MTSYVFLDRVKAVEGVVGVAYVSAVDAVKITTINRRNFDCMRRLLALPNNFISIEILKTVNLLYRSGWGRVTSGAFKE